MSIYRRNRSYDRKYSGMSSSINCEGSRNSCYKDLIVQCFPDRADNDELVLNVFLSEGNASFSQYNRLDDPIATIKKNVDSEKCSNLDMVWNRKNLQDALMKINESGVYLADIKCIEEAVSKTIDAMLPSHTSSVTSYEASSTAGLYPCQFTPEGWLEIAAAMCLFVPMHSDEDQ